MDHTGRTGRGVESRNRARDYVRVHYRCDLVEHLRTHGYSFTHGETTLRLATEFGFCYGVGRALEMAYEARERFPDRRIWITGEIIHNPGVNHRLEELGIRKIPQADDSRDRLEGIRAEDVVVIPAFGMEYGEYQQLRKTAAVLVDTTCGSVLSVWRSVDRYAQQGITAVIHGKLRHEETRATCSQVTKHPGAHFLVLRDLDEAGWVCDFLRGGISDRELLDRLPEAHSDGFDPNRHLERIGLANQTTMLSSESLKIAETLREAIAARYGPDAPAERFFSFDTICPATQQRQEAVQELIRQGCDLLIVVGGFNSSNTSHLVRIGTQSIPTYHIEDAENLISPVWIRHRPANSQAPVVEEGWLRPGMRILGLTAGASTPDREVGRCIERLLRFRGIPDGVIAELGGSCEDG